MFAVSLFAFVCSVGVQLLVWSIGLIIRLCAKVTPKHQILDAGINYDFFRKFSGILAEIFAEFGQKWIGGWLRRTGGEIYPKFWQTFRVNFAEILPNVDLILLEFAGNFEFGHNLRDILFWGEILAELWQNFLTEFGWK